MLSSVQEIVTNLIGSEEMAIFETDVSNSRLVLLASIGIEPVRIRRSASARERSAKPRRPARVSSGRKADR